MTAVIAHSLRYHTIHNSIAWLLLHNTITSTGWKPNGQTGAILIPRCEWNLCLLSSHFTCPDSSCAQAVEEELKKEFTDDQRAEAWNKAAKAVKTHHDELVESWQKAMDSVLVYVRLCPHEYYPNIHPSAVDD